ncbi:MAG: hypothetical protein Ct9H90mP7_5850 [Candidatus Neomarinimicrobiota bacterium]|nr:MAG: hypothetical protein Ct9H90mP7_5850 [Candidatus Neomarinimicrobiota bacterium]
MKYPFSFGTVKSITSLLNKRVGMKKLRFIFLLFLNLNCDKDDPLDESCLLVPDPGLCQGALFHDITITAKQKNALSFCGEDVGEWSHLKP